MNFVSQTFLVFFLICAAAYWLTPAQAARKGILLVASYLFAGWIHPWMAVVLAIYTLVNFTIAGRLNGKNGGAFFYTGLIFNLGGLIVVKYFGFFQHQFGPLLKAQGIQSQTWALNTLLPIGISFYTLQFVSYLIDVQKGTIKHGRSLLDFSLYAALFPKLVAGPIERGSKLLPQLTERVRWSWDRFNEGIWLIILGYLSKIFIADNVALLVDKVFALQKPTLLLLAAGSLAFTLQIYADFSAYTNLARGFGKLLGFELTENFNSPYISLSPSDFWQRWHISFSSWLRDYVFFPVRRWIVSLRIPEAVKVFVPSMAAMLFSGAWHGVGWNFIVWGAYFGLIISLYQVLGIEARLRNIYGFKRFLAWAVNFGLIVFGWTLFRAPSVGWLLNAFQNPVYGRAQDSLITSSVILILCLFYSLPMFAKRLLDNHSRQSILKLVFYACALAIIVIFIQSARGEFIYFNF